jgi:hypothetical protein
VFALSATALAIFVQADRDELLSRLTASPAGKVTWDVAFVSKVALHAGIPLLTLFVSQFPELTDSLGRWLQSLRSQLPQFRPRGYPARSEASARANAW